MNLAILTKSYHSRNGDKFGKISPNCQVSANKLNTWKQAMLVDLAILANVTNLASCLDVVKVSVTGYWNAFFFFLGLYLTN